MIPKIFPKRSDSSPKFFLRDVFPFILPATILLLCISLLQIHSMRFWAGAIGATGYPWSVALEMISLWLWFRPGRKFIRPLAWATTFLLLAGPLYRISDPIIQEALLKENLSVAISVEREILEQSIAEKQQELRSFHQIAQTRVGWQGKIDEAQAALEQKRAKLLELLANRNFANTSHSISIRLSWQRRSIIIMQLISVLIFQAAIVLSITTLSARHQQSLPSTRESPNASKRVQTPEAREIVGLLQKKIREKQEKGTTQAEIARFYKLAPKYITHILNYEKYPKPPLSINQLRRMAKVLDLNPIIS